MRRFGVDYTRKDDWLEVAKCFSFENRAKNNHAIYYWNGRTKKNCHYRNLTYKQLIRWIESIIRLSDNRYAIQIIW